MECIKSQGRVAIDQNHNHCYDIRAVSYSTCTCTGTTPGAEYMHIVNTMGIALTFFPTRCASPAHQRYNC